MKPMLLSGLVLCALGMGATRGETLSKSELWQVRGAANGWCVGYMGSICEVVDEGQCSQGNNNPMRCPAFYDEETEIENEGGWKTCKDEDNSNHNCTPTGQMEACHKKWDCFYDDVMGKCVKNENTWTQTMAYSPEGISGTPCTGE